MNPWTAFCELLDVLIDAWHDAREAADMAARLRAWAWIVRHPEAV